MSIYFTCAQIPELKDLTDEQRRIVTRRTWEVFYKEQTTTLCVFCLLAACLAGFFTDVAKVLIQDSDHKIAFLTLLGGLNGGIAAFVSMQFLIKQFRPYCCRYLAEHKEVFQESAN